MRSARGCVSVSGVPTRLDLALAAVLLVVSQFEVWAFGLAGGGAAAAGSLAAVAIASAWRTRLPVVSAAAVLGAAIVCAKTSGQPGSVTFAVAELLAFYRLGTLADRPRAYAGLGLGLLSGLALTDHLSLNKYLAVAVGAFVIPWLVGTVALRRSNARDLATARDRAVADERARLARELHDLVSHNVGMMVVQAGAGEVLLDKDPERTREALHAIETGGREALLELRRLLGLLRGSGADLAPQPTLARLDELVERVRSTGLDVRLEVEGKAEHVAPAVDLSAYRIVQEALTNVLKHAEATRADVVVRWSRTQLEIEVQDDGAGPSGDGAPGHGLAGMAERVAVLGGSLEAGPRGDRGYRLRALLPV